MKIFIISKTGNKQIVHYLLQTKATLNKQNYYLNTFFSTPFSLYNKNHVKRKETTKR